MLFKGSGGGLRVWKGRSWAGVGLSSASREFVGASHLFLSSKLELRLLGWSVSTITSLQHVIGQVTSLKGSKSINMVQKFRVFS